MGNNRRRKKKSRTGLYICLTFIILFFLVIVTLAIMVLLRLNKLDKKEDTVPTAKTTASSEAVTTIPVTSEETTTEYEVTIGSKVVKSTDEELDLSGMTFDGTDSLIASLSKLPSLKHVDLCDSNLTNEQMEILQAKFPDIKFVWKVTLGLWTIRTDTVAFSTLKDGSITYRLTNDDCKVLKYCTDMVALDIGHNKVTDISFLQYMPDLRILILVDNWDGDTSDHYLSDLSYVKYCKKLMYLEFFVGDVTDLSALADLNEMVDLNISYNPVSDITPLLNYPKLERLFLEHTNVSEADYELLKKTYPDAQIVLYGEGSVDQGWRTHPRYYAMKDMYVKNYVNDLFK